MNHRKNIYYWKSDRAYARGNVQERETSNFVELEQQLDNYLVSHFKKNLSELRLGGGQGDHITYLAVYPDQTYFVRVENGPEKDDYIDVESAVLRKVNEIGIPSPRLYHCDSSRSEVGFAIQVIEYINSKDLNVLEKNGQLDIINVAKDIGKYVAQWQSITPFKFGLFNRSELMARNRLEGYHNAYRDYFLLNWDEHLDYLRRTDFLGKKEVTRIKKLVGEYDFLLNIMQGCLVHKDLALWNILGSPTKIHAFIDWSDTISGDAMDDISLLACFHSGAVVTAALEGYSSIRQLPDFFEERIWLHLLRNMIFKAVIRVRGNYFNKSGDFFMNNTNSSDLKAFTLKRIDAACKGLEKMKTIKDL